MRVKDTYVMAHVKFIRLCNRKHKVTYHSKCCWSDHGSGSNDSHRHQNKKTRNDSCNGEDCGSPLQGKPEHELPLKLHTY